MKYIFAYAYLFCVFCCGFLYAGVPMAGAPFNMPSGGKPEMEFSAKDMEIAQQMDAYIQALPPDKQKEFYQGMEYLNNLPAAEQAKYLQELDKQTDFVLSKLDQMSPDDVQKLIENPEQFEDFVQKTLGDTGPAAPKPLVPSAPSEDQGPASDVEKQSALKNELKKLVELIDKLAELTDAFLVKAEQMHKLPASFKKWLTAKELESTNAELTWENLKANIEKCNALLREMKTQDPEKKTYKHLPGLVTNESLQNNLSHLQKTLAQHEPKFVTPTFGLGKLSKKSRQSLMAILNAFIEGFEKLDLIAELEKLIKEYEPTAEALKKAAEAAEEHARRLSEEGVPEIYTDIPSEGGADFMRYGGYDYDGSYGGRDGYYPSGGYHGGQYDYSYPSRGAGFQKEQPKAGAKGGAPAGKKGAPAAKKAPGAPDEATKRLDTLTQEAFEIVARMEDDIGDNKYMKNIDQAIMSKDALGTKDKEIIATLGQIRKSLREIREKMRGSNVWFSQIKDSKIKEKYRKNFKDVVETPQLTRIASTVKKVAEAKSGLTKDRLYAYFGEGTYKADEQRPETSMTITDITDAIEAIKQTIGKLGESKVKIPTPPHK